MTATMRAAVVRDGRIEVDRVATPVPGRGQVLVRTRACGICGSDLHLFEHGAEMMRLAEGLGVEPDNLTDGLVMGHEFVAEIVAFGPDTRRDLPVGERVVALPFLEIDGHAVSIGASSRTVGAYAEYFLLDEASLIRVPTHVTDEAAALTEPLAIGIHAVAKGAVLPHEIAVVIGCGPIGLACIAALKARGVTSIRASDYSAKRRELALRFGAEAALDPREGSPLAGLRAGSAVVFECVGAPGLIGQIVRDAPVGARVVVAGICSQEDTFLPLLAVSKELSLHFVSFYRPEEYRAALTMLAEGQVDWKSWVTGEVGLEDVALAFAELRGSDRHAKILIRPAR
jgi:threonine dehydrogenase-like Zn-dependent dehydrogenase